ncbi:MAG: YigZ family protein [Candidatus Aminicenantales bacterium]|jgi:uncharacterized YigZ family protein
MNGLSREAEITLEIKRSKFIGRSFRRAAPGAALEAVQNVRQAHRDADHHCWAYRVGVQGEQARYNDDGEPQGTAGPPILQVLERREMTNALIVVTRYYGGIKLGTGGLAHAYGEAAKVVLDESRPREIRRMAEIRAIVPHGLLAPLEKFVENKRGEILERGFAEHVVLRLRIPAADLSEFRTFHANLVNGRYEPVLLGEDYI